MPETATAVRPAGTQITPLSKQDAGRALAERPASAAVGIFSIVPRSYSEMMQVAANLYASGLLGKGISSASKAFAIIVAGAELGMPPMLALRAIGLIEGKIVIAADAQLGAFKRAGGRSTFGELSEKRAVLRLIHPNGDTHTEEFTVEMAKAAGLLGKDNWRKHLKAMLRSRAITAGLKSIGFEPVAGMYDPDEAVHFAPPEHEAALEEQAATTASEREGMSEDERALAEQSGATTAKPVVATTAGKIPFGPLKDQQYDARDADGYTASDKFISEVVLWAEKKLLEARKNRDTDAQARFMTYGNEAQRELDRRESEREAAAVTPADQTHAGDATTIGAAVEAAEERGTAPSTED
jgi:hypothetical protein